MPSRQLGWDYREPEKHEHLRGIINKYYRPDVTIEADPGTLAALVYKGRTLAEALRTGNMKIDGNEGKAERFLDLFRLPEPVAPAAGA